MQNQLNDPVSSIGCVICSLNFTSKDDANVVTTCGHIYHKSCLTKWFASAQELLAPTSCPDCRTHLNEETGIKAVYLRFTSDDSSDANHSELVRVQGENVKLVKQISVHEYDLKVLALEVKTLRAKNTRLANKVGVLTTTLKETKNTDTPQKNVAKKVPKGQLVTKNLRNRECTYQI